MDSIAGPRNLVSSDIVTEKLSQAWNVFNKVTGSTTHYLAGGAPRDLILGETPKDWDVWLPDMSNNSSIMLQHQLLAHYDFSKSNANPTELRISEEDKYTVFFDGVPMFIHSLGYFSIQGYNFNLIAMSGMLEMDMLFRSFDWDFCMVGYEPQSGLVGYDIVKTAAETRTIRFTHIAFNSTDAVRLSLERGRKFEKRFGLLLHPEDIQELESQLPELVELETELIRGYRLYDLHHDDKGAVLRGIAGVTWDGPSMEATHGKGEFVSASLESKAICVQHLLNYSESCMCGINVFKDLPEPRYFFGHQYLAETVVHGVVAEYEHGYRAQFGRITQLWELYDDILGYSMAINNKSLEHIALEKRYGVPVTPMTRVMALEMLVDEGAKFTRHWAGQSTLPGPSIVNESKKLQRAFVVDMKLGKSWPN